ncbi:hypothetical protein [Rhodoferax sp. PAMC 29310]|uniref:hypothetical protein n=1 Tax=Rhodoferax sp. PAMC 29310 TaxID=2822760 RepID=UPI001B31CF39|nr:hypothetical protein [Rhodoferax sp. PAMC 29310]
MRWRKLTPTWRRRLIVLAVVVGLALSSIFGYRAIRIFDYHQRVARGEIQVESLRGWMTLPYVAQRYKVPEPALRDALGLPPTGHDERNLSDWFRAEQIEPGAGRKIIESLILSRPKPAGTAPP